MPRYARVLLFGLVTLSLAACDADPTGPSAPSLTEPIAEPISPPLPGDKPDPITGIAGSMETAVWRQREAWVSDLDGIYFQFNCEDGFESEMIRLAGTHRAFQSIMDDPAGGFHYRWHYDATGAYGIGEESGEVFRVVDRANEVYNSAMGGSGVYRFETALIGTASARGFRMVTTGQYIVNANGDLVTQRGETTFECRG